MNIRKLTKYSKLIIILGFIILVLGLVIFVKTQGPEYTSTLNINFLSKLGTLLGAIIVYIGYLVPESNIKEKDTILKISFWTQVMVSLFIGIIVTSVLLDFCACNGTGKCNFCNGRGIWKEEVYVPVDTCAQCHGNEKIDTRNKRCTYLLWTKRKGIGYLSTETYTCPECGKTGTCKSCNGLGKML